MVTFRIISVGKPPKDWRNEAFQHYRKLISPFAVIEEVFTKEQQVSDNRGIEPAMKKEADWLLRVLSSSAYCVALDKSGATYSSTELSRHIEELFRSHSRFDFVIGGPYGLHDSFVRGADETMSLSRLTYPHDLARVMLAEQLYRSVAILNNLPYHK
jgi:23S rRNA (pseudouridine1915-N3)-methyltransferase